MSASHFLSHSSNPITPFVIHPAKIPTPFFSFNPSKFSFIIFSSSPINCSKTETRNIEYKNQDACIKFSEHISNSNSAVKVPTAPWMNESLLDQPREKLEFTTQKPKRDFTSVKNENHPDMPLTGKVGGGRDKVVMKKIFKSIEKLQSQNSEEMEKHRENAKFKFAPGDLWGNVNGPAFDRISEETDECSEFDIPLVEIEKEGKFKRLPWERNERIVIRRVKKKKVMAAEMKLDGMLLERLRSEAVMIKKWVKVKKAGVTQDVVDEVRFIWRNNELALLKFDLPLCRNMDRAREIVEVKTGGIVIWSNKDFLAVYRRSKKQPRSKDVWKRDHNSITDQENSFSSMNYQTITQVSSEGESFKELIHWKDHKWESLNVSSSLYEREADRLLDGLGPRFVDWWMHKPLPVDGDLLPEVVLGFKMPFRVCPPFTRSKLIDGELTYLRKLARPLPTHFVLGRNRNLQGLAAAIIKLWEKCHIAKIALKWGVPNMDNEQMAEELKSLTGGVLLLRNKFLIIIYRGKDFLPSEVANQVAEREAVLTRFQCEEEAARIKASESFSATYKSSLNSSTIGTLLEFHNFQTKKKTQKIEKTEVEVQLEAEQERLEKELKNQEQKLFILKKKIKKSAKVLEKRNNEMGLSEQDNDQEIISQEERVCLREMGLKNDSCLLLGRRGVYDGVIEGMHQHWKHKEIVKVITMQKKFTQIIYTANCLEAESGGILISVVKLKEGHAIIVYRGKNYRRPKLASDNLLNKREALSRSLEIQRIGSLRFFANQREQAIYNLKRKLAEFSERRNGFTSS